MSSGHRYQLVPPFLLDAETGRVWRYDDTKRQLLIVEREQSKVEKSWIALLSAKLTADAVDALNEVATNASSRAEHVRVAGLVDGHVKILDEHLKSLKT